MKKFCKFLITFILCFSFINIVNAEDPKYVAIYRNELAERDDEDYVKFFMVQYSKKGDIYAKPMNEFTVGNEIKGPNDSWSSYKGIKLINEKGKAKKIKPKKGLFKNQPYLHYDMTEGDNKLYLGEDELINYDWDLMLDKTDKYKQSSPNAILNELMCTYGASEDMIIKGGPSYVSFEVYRKGSGLFYQVYLDFVPVFNEYKVLEEGYTGFDGYIENNSSALIEKWWLNDHFSTTVFWNPTDGHYGCPSNIKVGFKGSTTVTGTVLSKGVVELGWKKVMDNKYSDKTTGIFNFEHDYMNEFVLYKNASYVDYEKGEKNTKQCIYSSQVCDPEQEGCVDNWEYALKESYYLDGKHSYELHENSTLLGVLSWQKKFKNIYYDIPSGLIDDDCSNLLVIYTNCINGDKTSHYYEKASEIWVPQVPDNYCVVSSQDFKGAQKLYSNKYLDHWTLQAVEEAMGESNGYLYKQLICDLKTKLEIHTTREKLGKTSNLLIVDSLADTASGETKEYNYNISFLPCTHWGTTSDFTCTTDECKSNTRYNINKQVRKILYYCEDTYRNLLKENSNEKFLQDRNNECSSFKNFYQSLVDAGIVDDMLTGCDIMTNDLKDKLNWILDVFKIAGPIMAVVLGMLDFAKIVVVEDADKEMKSAWKRFKTRLIAAALLFIVPILLSMLINAFIGDEINYNPYCGLLEEKIIE